MPVYLPHPPLEPPPEWWRRGALDVVTNIRVGGHKPPSSTQLLAFVEVLMKEEELKWWRRSSWLPSEWQTLGVVNCQLALDLSFLRSLKYGTDGTSPAHWLTTRWTWG